MILSKEKAKLLFKLIECNYACSSFQDLIHLRDLKDNMMDHHYKDLDSWKDISDARYEKEKQFKEILFLGSGDCSTLNVALLHKRLQYAINLMGGLQQPGHPENKEEYDAEMAYLKKGKDELKEAAKDILTALGLKPEDLI